MDPKQFLLQMDELLEQAPGTLEGSERLEELEGWDSVALVSFIALADEHFGRKLAPRDIGKCETVEDLYQLVRRPAASA